MLFLCLCYSSSRAFVIPSPSSFIPPSLSLFLFLTVSLTLSFSSSQPYVPLPWSPSPALCPYSCTLSTSRIFCLHLSLSSSRSLSFILASSVKVSFWLISCFPSLLWFLLALPNNCISCWTAEFNSWRCLLYWLTERKTTPEGSKCVLQLRFGERQQMKQLPTLPPPFHHLPFTHTSVFPVYYPLHTP